MSELTQQEKISEFFISEIKGAVIDAVSESMEDVEITFWLGTIEIYLWNECIKRATIEEVAKGAEDFFNNSKDPEERECWLDTADRLEKIAKRMRSIMKGKNGN